MIKVEINTTKSEVKRITHCEGTIDGSDEQLAHELCSFFNAVYDSRREALDRAIDMFISEKLKELEGDDEE